MDLTGRIIDFEQGETTAEETVELFAELVRTGMVWRLQGSYGRLASQLIQDGYISRDGAVLRRPDHG